MTFEVWWDKAGRYKVPTLDSEHDRQVAHAAWQAAQPKWRPMDEAPKKGSIDVLLLRKNGRQAVASYTHVFFDHPHGAWAYRDEIIPDPIAWMPLPEPSHG